MNTLSSAPFCLSAAWKAGTAYVFLNHLPAKTASFFILQIWVVSKSMAIVKNETYRDIQKERNCSNE